MFDSVHLFGIRLCKLELFYLPVLKYMHILYGRKPEDEGRRFGV